MTDRTVRHASFTIERVYDASPATVFAAWSDVDAKRRWFVEGDGENWETLDYAMDFRVGGSEHGRFRFKGKTVHGNETVFLDIVPDRRIVLAYAMSLDDERSSASLGTVDPMTLAGRRCGIRIGPPFQCGESGSSGPPGRADRRG